MTEVVGPLVDPVGITQTGGNSLERGRGYDFAIGSLGFRMAVTDSTPYIRGTAPFRKEQFDTAPVVGDQSLAGWWTRGQMSFHRGAGVKFYELLDGEQVLNRFKTSEEVDVSTPGSVSLVREAQQLSTPTSQPVAATSAPGDGFAWVDSAGAVYRAGRTGGAGAITAPTGAAHITTGPTDYFLATGNTITRFPVDSAGTATATDLYSHGVQIEGLWHAKNRLWMADANGDVYALATSPSGTLPVAVASTDKVFSIPGGSGNWWDFAATPASVYVSNGNTIYQVTLNGDGSVPTLAGGIVAAQLADGENIRSMRYHLGRLILCTGYGIRAAAVAGDGSLVVGPIIVQCRAITKTIGAFGSSVYALADQVRFEPSGHRLVRLNLDESIGDLVFAYSSTQVSPGFLDGGALSHDDGVLVWGNSSARGNFIEQRDATNSTFSMASSGSVTTGYHRFGTLEPKHYHSMLVRVGGTGGTINVRRVDLDGTETSLMTIDPLNYTGDPITLRMAGPVEAIALKFVLTADATDTTKGPELLGYQLRAQPAPRRQRLIKVPLEIQDRVRNRYGVDRGRRDSAWGMLDKLEELESTQTVAQFQDFRTGESGSAYIDEVEFRNDTPSMRGDSGFGGVAYVTLRKVT